MKTRNFQAQAYAAARAAGAAFTAATTKDAVDALNDGVGGAGSFATSQFQVILDPDERTAAADYLEGPEIANGNMVYTGTGL
jgi:hypothetical protein